MRAPQRRGRVLMRLTSHWELGREVLGKDGTVAGQDGAV
jgi:hypothetical protein